MDAIIAGTATINGIDGADWSLMYKGILPDYYVTLQEAINSNWIYGKTLSDFIPGKMITRKEFCNLNGHLPSSPNRQWYEADINYETGKRNSQRIVWSNDGLIFVSYDHYDTFFEIIGA